MGLEEILKALEPEAQLQIERLRSEADTEAAAITAKAGEEAKAIKDRHLASARQRLGKERERLVSGAKLEAKMVRLDAREALLERAFTAAQERLAQLRGNWAYPRYLMRLTREAVAEIGSDLRIAVSAVDEELIRAVVLELGVRAQISAGLNTCGGLEASTPDGRIRVVNTVEARLERAIGEVRREIAALLAPEEVSCRATTATGTPASEP